MVLSACLYYVLPTKVKLMLPEERHATLMVDEIQLTPGLVYDASSSTVLGAPTLPLADGTLPAECLATHALVFMLGGISTRWKQTIAYHFTGNSFHANTVKDCIVSIVQACEEMMLKVDAVVTDMGGGNQGVWKLFGIVCGKHSRPKAWCPHPCDTSRKLYFLPDVPHILKNLRNHITKGQTIFLPDETVKKHGLPCCEVSVEPIKKLIELDSNAELKLAPLLKASCVELGHYEKMKVGPALSLLNNDTGAALRVLVADGRLDKSALTTAWFVETIFKWFKLMTSRTTKLAFSHFDDVQHDNAVAFLNDVIELFGNISIGSVKKTVWKPVQTGVILATVGALELQALFLKDYQFQFLQMSRFSQDALENLFSTLRSKNPVPRVLEFRAALRAATMAQFLRPSREGSYAQDDCFLLTGMQGGAADTRNNVTCPDDFLDIENTEQESLEYLAGYVVSQVKKTNLCQDCRAAISTNSEGNKLTVLKAYNKEKPSLAVPSPAVLQLVETAESYVRSNRENLLENRVSIKDLQAEIQDRLFWGSCFPTCHRVSNDILAIFLRTRVRILVGKKNRELVQHAQGTQKCGSRSVGMSIAAKSIR